MAYEDFLDHTCDIYHVQRRDKSPGFGLPASPAFSYPEEPDEKDVPCHFHVKSGSTINISQLEPQNELDSSQKLGLPAGTDVRLNDKIVWKETGLEYTAGLPREIRGHHTAVILRRVDRQKPL